MNDLFDDIPSTDNVNSSPQQDNYQQSNEGYQRNNNYSGNQRQNNNQGGYQNNNNQGGGYQGGGSNYQNNNQGSYQGNNNYQGGGGYNRGGGGGYNKGGWNNNRKDEVQDPYRPVCIYVDKDFPQEVKDKLFDITSKLVNNKITVRYNGDCTDFHNRANSLDRSKLEVYTPFKGFNDIDTKFYFNSATSKHLAQQHFKAYDKIPNVVQSMLARNIRMIFGNKNDSPSMCVLTWSPDGATKLSEVTRDTGRGSFFIEVASIYGFSMLNTQDPSTELRLYKGLNIE